MNLILSYIESDKEITHKCKSLFLKVQTNDKVFFEFQLEQRKKILSCLEYLIRCITLYLFNTIVVYNRF